MARVQFYCDSGANIHSCNKSGWMDTVEDLGLGVGEWEKYTDEEKWEFSKDWADNYIDIGYETEGEN